MISVLKVYPCPYMPEGWTVLEDNLGYTIVRPNGTFISIEKFPPGVAIPLVSEALGKGSANILPVPTEDALREELGHGQQPDMIMPSDGVLAKAPR